MFDRTQLGGQNRNAQKSLE